MGVKPSPAPPVPLPQRAENVAQDHDIIMGVCTKTRELFCKNVSTLLSTVPGRFHRRPLKRTKFLLENTVHGQPDNPKPRIRSGGFS